MVERSTHIIVRQKSERMIADRNAGLPLCDIHSLCDLIVRYVSLDKLIGGKPLIHEEPATKR